MVGRSELVRKEIRARRERIVPICLSASEGSIDVY
jgi:hypothetical protein